MRLDHIAFRVKDRVKTAEFFQKAFGYKVQTEFPIDFGDGDVVKCLALEPPEKLPLSVDILPWLYGGSIYHEVNGAVHEKIQEYHMPPEIFVSDGTPNSIVGKWVAARGGIGGIHHLAYQVKSVEEKMQEWKDKGYAEFTSDKPFQCPGLTQAFTQPSDLCGVIFEFIEREEFGFCSGNVRQLMLSTADANMK
jgi:catechol 2,3-dioxygenase-like lactoylglutathione lyase family enzyme